ncbi:MAG TPA: hypothetical protein VJ953_12335 [Saprospiraceae bacterium]|nr:hypothetical protein [Saprospiraceae bacterium]
MYNSFISVVCVLQADYQLRYLNEYLQQVYQISNPSFTDLEIILVNNKLSESPDSYIEQCTPEIRKHIFLLNLSNKAVKSNAILAGLDRANGDYTLIFEPELHKRPELIIDLFERTRQGFDIVYLRAKRRKLPAHIRFFNRLFYLIMRNFSPLTVDEGAYDSRIISRRALNSLLRLRENLRYMKAIYSLVGYPTSSIELEAAIPEQDKSAFSDRFKTSLIAISSFTSFLRTILLTVFLISFVFLIGVIANALLVKFTGFDILGNPEEVVKGWTFLVILVSLFFAANFLILYIMSIYLSNIYQELKQRPLYIIESIKRF